MASRKPYLLRIDPDLWEELEIWARDELRSANAQIEYILRQAVSKRKGAAATAKTSSRAPTQPTDRPDS